MALHAIIVHLAIQPEEFQRLYQGTARDVTALSSDGRWVRFPANILRPFVTRTGINGRFAIHFSDENRFLRIEKID